MVRPTARFAPLQPSKLRFFSGPSSPASPISPIAARPCFFPLQAPRQLSSWSSSSTSSSDTDMMEAPPMEPMPWVWCCHHCSSYYPLGATSRCLNDGHQFCGGWTRDFATGRLRTHKSCAHEFDFNNWEQWGRYRRERFGDRPTILGRKDCTKRCDSPSACQCLEERERAERSRIAARTRSSGYASSETLAAVAATFQTFEAILGEQVTIAETPSSSKTVSIRFPIAAKSLPPTPPPTPPPNRPVLRRSGYTTERRFKETSKKSSTHKTTALSPIREEHSARSSPSPAPNGGVALPALEFSAFPSTLKDFQHSSFLEEEHADPVKALDALHQEVMDFEYDADIDTRARSPSSHNELLATPSPQGGLPGGGVSISGSQGYLDLRKRAGRRGKVEEEEKTATSSRRDALPGGSIGGALTPPSTPSPKGGRKRSGGVRGW